MIQLCLLVLIASSIHISQCSPEEMMGMMKMMVGPPETMTECLEDIGAKMDMKKEMMMKKMESKWMCKEKVIPAELKDCIPKEEVKTKLSTMKSEMMEEYIGFKMAAKECLKKKAAAGDGCTEEPSNYGPCKYGIVMEMLPEDTQEELGMCMMEEGGKSLEGLVGNMITKMTNPARKERGQKFLDEFMKPMLEKFRKMMAEGGPPDGGPFGGEGPPEGGPFGGEGPPNGGPFGGGPPPFAGGKGPRPIGKGKGGPPFGKMGGKGKFGRGGKGKDGKGKEGMCLMQFCTPKAMAECAKEAKLDEAIDMKMQKMFDMMKYMDDEVLPVICECMKPKMDTAKLYGMLKVEDLDCKNIASKDTCNNFMTAKVEMMMEELKEMLMDGPMDGPFGGPMDGEESAPGEEISEETPLRRKRSSGQLLVNMFEEHYNDMELDF